MSLKEKTYRIAHYCHESNAIGMNMENCDKAFLEKDVRKTIKELRKAIKFVSDEKHLLHEKTVFMQIDHYFGKEEE